MSVELRVRWSFSLPFGFTFWSYANHSCVPPILFSLFCAIRSSFRFFKRFFRSPAETSSNSAHYRVLRSLPRRFPTAERLPELRQFPICPVLSSLPNAYLGFWCPYTFWQRLSVCLTTGRNHRFLYPPFFYYRFARLPLCRIPTTACRILRLLRLVHRCFLHFYERYKHFLFRSFFLYLYYSKFFVFVKGFLKKIF